MNILPCPFCGGEARYTDIVYFEVECSKCGAVGQRAFDADTAIEVWNTRTDDKRIAELAKDRLEFLKRAEAAEAQLDAVRKVERFIKSMNTEAGRTGTGYYTEFVEQVHEMIQQALEKP